MAAGGHGNPESLRIVLIGKTGSGKRSSGNTILGRKQFEYGASPQSVTTKCEKAECVIDGRHVDVVDTPGLFDTNFSISQSTKKIRECISLVHPGPHVFLQVLPIGRFSIEDTETLKLIEKVLGENYQKFTIVLFTRGDALERDEISIEQYIKDDCDDACKNLIRECGGRYHVFNNQIENQSQVIDLIKKINMMENEGKCYIRKMLHGKQKHPVCEEKLDQ